MLRRDPHLLRIPRNILDALYIYFDRLLSIVRQERYLPEDHYVDVLHIYSPLIRQIFVTSPWRWEDCDALEWRNAPEELRERRSTVHQTFNSFVLEIDKVFCPMHVRTPPLTEIALQLTNFNLPSQNNVRPIRDPELSWCHSRGHSREQCIADFYSLP